LKQPTLPASSSLLARVVDFAADAVVSIGADRKIILFNQGAQKIFGYTAMEAIGQSLDKLLEDAPMGPGRWEIRARRKNGAEFAAEASISRVSVDGQTILTFILQDVTERLIREEALRASLRARETSLNEIHHQVRNHLQAVSSLLGLQSRVVSDPEMRLLFQESQNRIHSMALLHESLYQTRNRSQIDFPEYIRQLAARLFNSHGVAADRIRLRTDLDRLALDLNTAVPCGLIVNELISNSLKYAFPSGRVGEIRIELREHADGIARLTVADNGVGLKADVDWANTRSLGLRLVRTLAEQLGADIEVNSGAGTEVRLVFTAAA